MYETCVSLNIFIIIITILTNLCHWRYPPWPVVSTEGDGQQIWSTQQAARITPNRGKHPYLTRNWNQGPIAQQANAVTCMLQCHSFNIIKTNTLFQLSKMQFCTTERSIVSQDELCATKTSNPTQLYPTENVVNYKVKLDHLIKYAFVFILKDTYFVAQHINTYNAVTLSLL